jgi:hypothetical protein
MTAFFTAHAYLFSQIFGFAAMGTAILPYQFSKQKTVNLILMLVAALWCAHYACLGHVTPIVINLLNVLRAWIYAKRDRPWANRKWIPAAFCAVAVVLMIATWENALSLLPCAASVAASIANWQTDTKKLRALTVPVCVCWLTYNAFQRSIAGVANEAFTLVSILVAYFRYDRKKKE